MEKSDHTDNLPSQRSFPNNIDLYSDSRHSSYKLTILYYTFNQDGSCLALGTTSGFSVFLCDPLELLVS